NHSEWLRCERTTLFFFSSRRRHTISKRDWSSDVCSSDLFGHQGSNNRIFNPFSFVFLLSISNPYSNLRLVKLSSFLHFSILIIRQAYNSFTRALIINLSTYYG